MGCGSPVPPNKPAGLASVAPGLDSPLENHQSASLTRPQVGMSELSRAKPSEASCRGLPLPGFRPQPLWDSRHRVKARPSRFPISKSYRVVICAHCPGTLVYEV